MILYFKNKNYNIIAYGPIPTFKEKYKNFIPINRWYGDEISRNKLTYKFNKYYENKCNENNIYFMTLYYDLINKNYETIEGYHLSDNMHLNQKVLYLLIQKLYKINVINRKFFLNYHLEKIKQLSKKPKNYNWLSGNGFLGRDGIRKTKLRPNGLDKDIAKSNLLTLKKIFDKNKLFFYLIDGTLLGAIRDNNFIDGDSDTDIRILFSDIPLLVNIVPELIENGLIPLRIADTEISFVKNNEYIDISFLNKRTRFTNNFDKIIFLDTEFNIPSNTEEYLRICYGNWKIKSDKHTWANPE